MTNLYAFTGYKHSGKSTAASYVAEKLGATRLNFKDALVSEIKENWGAELLRMAADEVELGRFLIADEETTDEIIDQLFKQKPPSIRGLMQRYGTDVRRGDDPDYWVKQWMSSYAPLHPEPVVVDDVRFINEAEQIKSLQGIIIRIERRDIENGGTHSSETEQNQIKADYTVRVLKGDLPGLERALDYVLDTIIWNTL